MNKIYKYPLEITDQQKIVIPHMVSILSVAVQDNQLVLYATIDPADESVSCVLVTVRGTGHSYDPLFPEKWVFMGTHMTHDDSLVWHVWVSQFKE